jgi:hypothetical protein
MLNLEEIQNQKFQFGMENPSHRSSKCTSICNYNNFTIKIRTLLAMSFEAGAAGSLREPVFVSDVRRSLATFCIRTELSPSAVIPAWASPIKVPKRLQDK